MQAAITLKFTCFFYCIWGILPNCRSRYAIDAHSIFRSLSLFFEQE